MVKEQGSKIAKALHQAQGLMSGVKKDSVNPFFKSKYSSLGSVFEAIMPAFQACDIAVTQLLDVTDSGSMLLVTKLLHVSGEELVSRMILPSITDPQKLGGAITYYKRYALLGIAAVPSVDDDGQEATRAVKIDEFVKEKESNECISATKLEQLTTHEGYSDLAEREILKVAKIERVSDLKNMHFNEAMNFVAREAKKLKENPNP